MNDELATQSCALAPCRVVAKMLSVSPRTVWRLRSAGKLPKPVSIGGSKRWKMSDIILFLDCNCDMTEFQARKSALK